MSEPINNTTNTEQQPTTPTPEAKGGPGSERTFTQDDVNRIVSERLAREKAKAEPSAIDERENAMRARENELKAREARLECRDFLEKGLEDMDLKGYNSGYAEGMGPKALLDILDTSDSARFKKTVLALLEAGAFLPQHQPLKLPGVDRMGSGEPDPIAAAFRPKS